MPRPLALVLPSLFITAFSLSVFLPACTSSVHAKEDPCSGQSELDCKAGCRFAYEPGCKTPQAPVGCFVRCEDDADCVEGRSCKSRTIAACHIPDPNPLGVICDPCSAEAKLCMSDDDDP